MTFRTLSVSELAKELGSDLQDPDPKTSRLVRIAEHKGVRTVIQDPRITSEEKCVFVATVNDSEDNAFLTYKEAVEYMLQEYEKEFLDTFLLWIIKDLKGALTAYNSSYRHSIKPVYSAGVSLLREVKSNAASSVPAAKSAFSEETVVMPAFNNQTVIRLLPLSQLVKEVITDPPTKGVLKDELVRVAQWDGHNVVIHDNDVDFSKAHCWVVEDQESRSHPPEKKAFLDLPAAINYAREFDTTIGSGNSHKYTLTQSFANSQDLVFVTLYERARITVANIDGAQSPSIKFFSEWLENPHTTQLQPEKHKRVVEKLSAYKELTGNEQLLFDIDTKAGLSKVYSS